MAVKALYFFAISIPRMIKRLINPPDSTAKSKPAEMSGQPSNKPRMPEKFTSPNPKAT